MGNSGLGTTLIEMPPPRGGATDAVIGSITETAAVIRGEADTTVGAAERELDALT